MKIHQLSVSYLAEQDRILVRINTAASREVRLWLTRRLMLGLWPLLSKLLTEHLLKLEAAGRTLDSADTGLRKMLADFRKEEFLRDADFETPYQENQQSARPEEPLLVTDVDASPLPDGRLRLSFNEHRKQGEEEPRSFHLEMQPKLMQGLMHLLEQSLARAQWGDPLATTAIDEGAAADENDPVRRPRYMN